MFLRTFVAAAAAALLLPAGNSLAQPPARSDLQMIFQDALRNDASFASARFARQAATEREPQALAATRPAVSAGFGASLNNFDSSAADVNRTYYSWGPSINFSMPLYRPQNDVAVTQARLSVQAADAAFEQARQDLLLRVSQAYFDVLAAQDALEAIAASKKAVAEQLAQAKREFEVGTKTIVDTHEAQARYDQIVAQEQVALGDLIVRRNALRAIIGRDPGELVPLREAPQLVAPQPTDIDVWTRQAEEASYPVAAARANAQIAERETQRAKYGERPTVDLVASAQVNRSDGSTTIAGSNTSRNGTVGVQLNWPLYTGGLTQSRIREALANEERSKQDLEFARRNAAQGARQAYTGVDFGLAQVRALESAEVSAKSQLESTRLGYRVGVRINLDVLNATTQLFNTQRDLKKARYDFLVNGLRLQAAAGSLQEESLQGVNALLAR
jgi:outer membrane protein